MTEDNEESEFSGTFLESKLYRILTIIIAVALIFIGPTYVPYVFANLAGLDYFVSIGIGLVLFIVGLALLIYLIKKKAVIL
jgi:hypothetical protein